MNKFGASLIASNMTRDTIKKFQGMCHIKSYNMFLIHKLVLKIHWVIELARIAKFSSIISICATRAKTLVDFEDLSRKIATMSHHLIRSS